MTSKERPEKVNIIIILSNCVLLFRDPLTNTNLFRLTTFVDKVDLESKFSTLPEKTETRRSYALFKGLWDENYWQPWLAVAASHQPCQHLGVESFLCELQRGQQTHEDGAQRKHGGQDEYFAIHRNDSCVDRKIGISAENNKSMPTPIPKA